MIWFAPTMTVARAMVIAVALVVGVAGPAGAQDSAPLDAERLESLVEMLENEQERETFLRQLRTLGQAQAEQTLTPEPTGMAAVLDTLSARLGAA